MKVLAIMEDGFEELEAVGTIALLRRSGIEVTVSTFNNTKCTARFDTTLDNLADLSSIDPYSFDLLFVPGGSHYQKLLKNELALKLMEYYCKNKKIACICAAPTILGRLGLLKGRKYTCFTSMNDDFGGEYVDQYAVTDNNLVTGRSAAAVIDFAFAVIRLLLGEEREKEVKKSIYY